MAQLMVRNLPENLVKALKQRAAKHNRSAEQEHREILRAALGAVRRRPLADVLAAMPNVGLDQDFARKQTDRRGVGVYLIDTDVISEARKGDNANGGVKTFFRNVSDEGIALYLSVVTIGEMRQGVEAIRYRGDAPQAKRLETWLNRIAKDYADAILPFDEETAHVWGRLRVPHPENPLDKQIAATALIYDLIVVTRNSAHYEPTGVRVLNPFT